MLYELHIWYYFTNMVILSDIFHMNQRMDLFLTFSMAIFLWPRLGSFFMSNNAYNHTCMYMFTCINMHTLAYHCIWFSFPYTFHNHPWILKRLFIIFLLLSFIILCIIRHFSISEVCHYAIYFLEFIVKCKRHNHGNLCCQEDFWGIDLIISALFHSIALLAIS